MARDLSTPLAPSVFDGKKMKTLPAKEIKLKSKDKHLGKKGHDSYEVDGRTTFVNILKKTLTVRKKRKHFLEELKRFIKGREIKTHLSKI